MFISSTNRSVGMVKYDSEISEFLLVNMSLRFCNYSANPLSIINVFHAYENNNNNKPFGLLPLWGFRKRFT